MENEDILKPGTVLFEYRVLEFVDEGNWAYVYKAEHLKLPRLVAIKQLKPERVEDKDALRRFLTDANVVARIGHPNVVTIYNLEYDEKANSYYIITEFAEKGTLANRLEKVSERLSIDEVLHLAMGMCSGMEAVHRKGIVHRDIKPSNILLFDVGESQDIPKLSDFGIARASTSAGMVGQPSSGAYGSLNYMSPEQLDEDAEVDHRSDLYSLGVLLYEILTGQVPFTGEAHDIFWGHMYVSPVPPSELRPDIPEALEQIVMRALRKDRNQRYQSAADMREAFEAILDIEIRKERKLKFEAFLEQGLAILREGEWETATQLLRQADVLEPGDRRVLAGLRQADEQQRLKRLYERGVQYLGERNWEEARVYLAEVVGYDRNYASGLAGEQLQQATQELERERNRRDLTVQYLTGMGHFRTQQWTEAIKELEGVVAKYPEFRDAADRLAEAKRYSRVEQLLEQVQHCQEQEDWEKVVECLEEVVRLGSPHIDVAEELNHARKQRADAREAQLLAAWYEAGIAHLTAGDLEQARASFQRIYERRPNYQDVAVRLKEIEEKSKRKDRNGFRRIAARMRQWVDVRSLYAKVSLIIVFGIIVFALFAGAVLVTGIPFPLRSMTMLPVTSPASLTTRLIDEIQFFVNGTVVDDINHPHYVTGTRQISIEARVWDTNGNSISNDEILCEWTLPPQVQVQTTEAKGECKTTYQAPENLGSQLVKVVVKGRDTTQIAGESMNRINIVLQSNRGTSNE